MIMNKQMKMRNSLFLSVSTSLASSRSYFHFLVFFFILYDSYRESKCFSESWMVNCKNQVLSSEEKKTIQCVNMNHGFTAISNHTDSWVIAPRKPFDKVHWQTHDVTERKMLCTKISDKTNECIHHFFFRNSQ